jgi:proline dehydrogenase
MTAGAQVRRRLEARAARGYVAGPQLADALDLARRLRDGGVACTIGYWDGPGAPATLATSALRRTLGALADPAAGLDAVVAVKAPPLAGDHAVLAIAEGDRAPLLVDAPAPGWADDALALALALAARGCDAGIALPGRWARSAADAEVAIEHGLAVRLVKGEWADPDGRGPGHPAGFVALADQLAGRARQVGVASHDPAVVAAVLPRLVDAGTPCELELLLGLPVQPVCALAWELGVPIRAYIPWGTSAWVPYDATAARHSPELARRLLGDAAVGRRRWQRTLALTGEGAGPPD